MAIKTPPVFDFDNQADADKTLKKVAQLMGRAGQPVVSFAFDPKTKRIQGVAQGYREAQLTLASGQTVTLRVAESGMVYQVLLNGQLKPLKNQDDMVKAIGEIAGLADANQGKFQAALARKKVDMPKGIKTAAPKLEQVLTERNAELDAQIAERQKQVEALKEELGDTGATAGQTVDAANFTAMRGHVAEGTVVRFADGRQLTLRSTMSGWTLQDAGGAVVAGPMSSAVEVESAVVRMDGEVSLDSASALAELVLSGGVLDSASHAAATLRIALDIVETNRPINLAAGNTEQAELEARCADSYRQALAILDSTEEEEDDQSALFDGSDEEGIGEEGEEDAAPNPDQQSLI